MKEILETNKITGLTRREFLKGSAMFTVAAFLRFPTSPNQLFRPFLSERQSVVEADKISKLLTCDPGHVNYLINSFTNQINLVTPYDLKEYFSKWQGDVKEVPELSKRNRMMDQLLNPLPNGDFRKRGLDYDIRNPAKPQGLGYTDKDLNIMAEATSLGFKADTLFRQGEDGIFRGCAVLQLKELPIVLKKYAEGMKKMGDTQSSETRVAQMVNDFGITEIYPDVNGSWVDFKSHETYLGDKRLDGYQPEKVQAVRFTEITESDQEQNLSFQDVRNPGLLLVLYNRETREQHVELFVLSTTTDIVDPERDLIIEQVVNSGGKTRNADGGRLLPFDSINRVPNESNNSETIKPPAVNPPEKPKPPKPPKKPNIGNPGNAKPVGKSGEKGPEFYPPESGGPGTKGKSDNPDKGNKGNKGRKP